MRAARMLILFCTFAAAACAVPPRETTQVAATTATAEQATSRSVAAVHGAARDSCVAAGFPQRTGAFARCVAAFHAREAARARAEARTLMERAALRHGLCIDPVRFELSRCIEI